MAEFGIVARLVGKARGSLGGAAHLAAAKVKHCGVDRHGRQGLGVEQQLAQHATPADPGAEWPAQHPGEPLLALRGESSHALDHGGAGPDRRDTVQDVGCGRLGTRSGGTHGKLRLGVQPGEDLLDPRRPFRVLRLQGLQHEQAGGHGKLVAARRVGAHDQMGRRSQQAPLAIGHGQAFGTPEQRRREEIQGVAQGIMEPVEVIVAAEQAWVASQMLRVEGRQRAKQVFDHLAAKPCLFLGALVQRLIEELRLKEVLFVCDRSQGGGFVG